jgi:hypothetical protein
MMSGGDVIGRHFFTASDVLLPFGLSVAMNKNIVITGYT